MIKNSFFQKIGMTIFFGFCAAGVIQFYIHFIWRANEDINGKGSWQEITGNAPPTKLSTKIKVKK